LSATCSSSALRITGTDRQACGTCACVSIRQRTLAYVSIENRRHRQVGVRHL
jgi:hypothetical protein